MIETDHFFDIQGDKVILNPNILNIPELKAVYEKYGLIAITFVYYMCHPQSPYKDYDEGIKEEIVFKDYKGSYKPSTLIITKAIAKVTEIYTTPKMRFYEGQKAMLDRLSVYLKNSPLDDDNQEGNFDKVIKLFEKGDKILSSFDRAEQAKNDELKGRGNTRLSYDEVN